MFFTIFNMVSDGFGLFHLLVCTPQELFFPFKQNNLRYCSGHNCGYHLHGLSLCTKSSLYSCLLWWWATI